VDVPLETALDVLNIERKFSCTQENGASSGKLLWCRTYDVGTHDYRRTYDFLLKEYVRNPPNPWDAVGVSAHANTLEVVEFLQKELEHNGLDNQGKAYNSVVHYLGEYSDNAFWYPRYNIFVYGQRESAGFYYASGISIVAHEIFHGVTHFTAGLGSKNQSGALNESYSDIFGILFANLHKLDIEQWNWEIGIPETNYRRGFPIRDLSNPSRFGQPEHMNDYVETDEDQGGVHFNNGIHNKAAFNLLTSKDAQGRYLFDANSAALLFYLALCRLRPTSDFSESRLALTFEVSNCFQEENVYRFAINAINLAFDAVGIK
jgi:Zn-dependent metalloprotease